MKSSWLAWAMVFALVQPGAAQYRTALPGYRYGFPRDNFDHSDYQTEWWYFTGNVTAADGHRFGFELTFFREGVNREAKQPGRWDIRDLYLAHLALSDIGSGEFYHSERINRAGPGIAGIDEATHKIWNGNWSILWNGDDQQLQAMDTRFALALLLRSEKPPVIHGENGVSQKAEELGHASHYISLTRLKASGSIELESKRYQVTGVAWMDHEFFTQQLEANQVGWDWLSIQLNDNTEIMIYRIRRKDGTVDPFSSGTFVDAAGRSTHLIASDFVVVPSGDSWKSAVTGAVYPIQWKISIAKLGVELEARTPLKAQEFSGRTKIAPSYWEGAIDLLGQHGAEKLRGVGYLEMTGYDKAVKIGH